MTVILYCTIGGVDIGRQSGRPAFVRQALDSFAGRVVELALPPPRRFQSSVAGALRKWSCSYLPERAAHLLHVYDRMIRTAVVEQRPDIVFSTSTVPFTYFRAPPGLRTVSWADAPLNAMVSGAPTYPYFERAARSSIQRGLDAEALSLANVTHAAFPSEWACRYATALSSRTDVICAPFGPNLDRAFIDSVRGRRARVGPRRSSDCPAKLLMVGVEWVRKGGDLIFDVLKRLNGSGLERYELTVVGPGAGQIPSLPNVRALGRLAKNSTADLSTLLNAYAVADVLVFPSRRENFGAAVVEAAACGLPVVVSETDGCYESVERGRFGLVVPRAGDEAEEWCRVLSALCSSEAQLRDLSRAGCKAVDEWLNYPAGISRILAS